MRKKVAMAPKRTKAVNRRLLKLRGQSRGSDSKEMSQTEFGKTYFGVPIRTYQRYESSQDSDLPGPVLKLLALYETHGLRSV